MNGVEIDGWWTNCTDLARTLRECLKYVVCLRTRLVPSTAPRRTALVSGCRFQRDRAPRMTQYRNDWTARTILEPSRVQHSGGGDPLLLNIMQANQRPRTAGGVQSDFPKKPTDGRLCARRPFGQWRCWDSWNPIGWPACSGKRVSRERIQLWRRTRGPCWALLDYI